MARPGRPERNRTARSFRQLRRFHHGINSDEVFGTHNRRNNASQRFTRSGEVWSAILSAIYSYGTMYMSTPVVLITGALTGIGRATALAFAREGARMVVSGRRHEAGQALAAELRNLGAEAEFVRVDVRHDDEVRNLINQTVARFGRLDVAVNNAGTEGKPGPVTEQ